MENLNIQLATIQKQLEQYQSTHALLDKDILLNSIRNFYEAIHTIKIPSGVKQENTTTPRNIVPETVTAPINNSIQDKKPLESKIAESPKPIIPIEINNIVDDNIEVVTKIEQKQFSNIKELLELNDRLLIVQTLFNGDRNAFDAFILKLENCNTMEAATSLVDTVVTNVEENEEHLYLHKMFTKILEKKFF